VDVEELYGGTLVWVDDVRLQWHNLRARPDRLHQASGVKAKEREQEQEVAGPCIAFIRVVRRSRSRS